MIDKQNKPIGVFDSGLGGLTFIKEIREQLPKENVVYLGDTARVPYGTKSRSSVNKFSIENAEFLMQFDIKSLIIACSTASSFAYDMLRLKYDFPVIGVIDPGAEGAVKSTKKGRIGVVGTRATINSGAFENAIKAIDKKIEVFSCPCPLFVPLAEEGWVEHPVTYDIAKRYLSFFEDKDIDVLVLGCTHYPLLRDVIEKVMGEEIFLVDTSVAVVKKMLEILKLYRMENSGESKREEKLYVTDYTQNFLEISRNFLGDDSIKWESVSKEQLNELGTLSCSAV